MLDVAATPPEPGSQPSSAAVAVDRRVARSRAAVLAAAAELLVTGGPDAVTVDAVVVESGVAKSTIYRHWRSRDDLLVDVFRASVPPIRPPSRAPTFRDALSSLVDQAVDHLTDPHWARMIPALLMLQAHEPELAAMQEEIQHQQHALLYDVLRRGIEEGDLDPAIDLEEAATMINGPLLWAHLSGATTVDRALGRRIADRFCAAYATRP